MLLVLIKNSSKFKYIKNIKMECELIFEDIVNLSPNLPNNFLSSILKVYLSFRN